MQIKKSKFICEYHVSGTLWFYETWQIGTNSKVINLPPTVVKAFNLSL